MKSFFDIDDADWLRLFDTNVLSGVRLSRHHAPRMPERGWGRVIFISNKSALNIPREMMHYGMTKTAQLAVSRGLAEEMAGSAVMVNAVLPGPTLSEGVEEFLRQQAQQQEKTLAEIEAEFFHTAANLADPALCGTAREWRTSSSISPRRQPRQRRGRRSAWTAAS